MSNIYSTSYNNKRYEFATVEELQKFVKKVQPMLGNAKLVVLVKDDKYGKYQCSGCNMYVPESKQCTNVLGNIELHGTCQIRMAGPNAKSEQINPFRLLKDEVNYDERREGFGCIRCIRFVAPKECKIIKDKVAWNNCCNFQFDGDLNKSARTAERYEEEQKQLGEQQLKRTGGDRVALEQQLRKLRDNTNKIREGIGNGE